MTGNAVITVSPPPNAFAITGGGSYCQGGAGLPVSFNGTLQSGVNYQLLLNGNPVGAPVPGPGVGGVINFGNQTAAGTYSVIATVNATGCTRTVLSVTITINPVASRPYRYGHTTYLYRFNGDYNSKCSCTGSRHQL